MGKFVSIPVEQRLWSKIDKDGPVPDYAPHLGPCWLWNRSLDTKGYAQIKVNGAHRMAHRVVYEIIVGPIPPTLVIDHLCRVPRCVNPSHLEPVTFAENIRRGNAISVQCSKRTECPKGHPYDERNTVRDHGRRRCRTCINAYRAKWQKKMRAKKRSCNFI